MAAVGRDLPFTHAHLLFRLRILGFSCCPPVYGFGWIKTLMAPSILLVKVS